MEQKKTYLWKTLLQILVISIHTSCGSTKTSQGASTGAIIGGLLDGWGGAATGALIGGGIGLMEDTADDKKIRQEQKDRELALLEKSSQGNIQHSWDCMQDTTSLKHLWIEFPCEQQ